MMFKIRMISVLFYVGLLFLIPDMLMAQQQPKYNIKFIRAVLVGAENNNQLQVIFLVTPIKMEDYPPVVSTKVIYSLGNEPEKRADILNTQDNINLTVYGNNIKEKSRQLYELVKSHIDLSMEDISIFVFTFMNSSPKKIDKMSMTYGFWEKRNQNIRVEKRYDFKVETLY